MEWISVKDEVPRSGQMVIVEGAVAYYRGGVWLTVTGEPWPGRVIQWPVNHWMPLPDPPKEQP